MLGAIERESALLRVQFPQVRECIPALVQWKEGDAERWSLSLDIRWPQHQSLVSGPAQPTFEAAVAAAFRLARERLERKTA